MGKWGPYGFSEDRIQCIEEYYPKALEKTYKGASGYIYSATSIIDSRLDIRIPDCATSSLPVAISGVEYVQDAYEKILQAEKEGLIAILRYEKMTSEKKE